MAKLCKDTNDLEDIAGTDGTISIDNLVQMTRFSSTKNDRWVEHFKFSERTLCV